MHHEKQFGSKKIGHIHFGNNKTESIATYPCSKKSDGFVIVFLKSGSRITSDFKEYVALGIFTP